MIVFSPLSTRRLDVTLHELGIGDEIALCYLPDKAHEKALTAFLQCAIKAASTPSPKHIADPRAWTVSERLLVLAHYTTHTASDGPNYAVTEAGKLFDYLDMSRDLPGALPTFDACGDQWTVHPLIGAEAEALETLQLESDLNGHSFWLMGLLAAQLKRPGETAPDAVANPTEYIDWLRTRHAVMRALPGSVTSELFAKYRDAQAQAMQFFRVWFDGEGIIVLPKEAGDPLSPARFLVLACLSELALSLTGKS
ncbi:hypothetical protein LA345_38945 (plasmid) [Burkholderia vietnamiensis]|uniref:Uncharacterized protein n=1 Tax=Burkholderia vietnamiensis (strain G4 / LMG 22486) TaxID=269482 RepID=A4JWE9_BURVG|nr:hypothetical protein Bcep1808_7732 [Burkholderia vietnamiensis G4]MCB4349777.1 hypothetical protein [Burkholderia vietnamiensis]